MILRLTQIIIQVNMIIARFRGTSLPVCATFAANGHLLFQICNIFIVVIGFFYEISHKNSAIE